MSLVLVLAGQVVVGQADVGLHVQRVIGVHILQSVVGLDQEDVDLVVIGGGILAQQGFVQLVLVVVVLVGVMVHLTTVPSFRVVVDLSSATSETSG